MTFVISKTFKIEQCLVDLLLKSDWNGTFLFLQNLISCSEFSIERR